MQRALSLLAMLPLVGVCSAYAQISPLVEFRQQRLDEVKLTRPALSKLAVQEQLIVLEWLSLNCAVGNEEWERLLKAVTPSLATAFLEAYTLGPLKTELAGHEEVLRKQYDDIQAALKESGAALLGEEMSKSLMGISQEEYIRQELDRQRIAYRSSALTGLGFVGSKEILDDLKRIAETIPDPTATSAKEAIRAIEEREMPR